MMPTSPHETRRLYLDDSYLGSFVSKVTAVDGFRVALDQSAFYPSGGGQPHDQGTIDELSVTEVAAERGVVWHTVDLAGNAQFRVGDTVTCALDWQRRHAAMRTHTAMHLLCGAIATIYSVPVTGGNMSGLTGRMDFEFGSFPPTFREDVTNEIDNAIRSNLPIRVEYLETASRDLGQEHVRTKTSLVPADLERVRLINIVGFDCQADGGTHVRSTAEVGGVAITKIESKGRSFKRVRLSVLDEPPLEN
jgi:misacylated tRNA(Ala) deacylase